jgi:hypothetical protein
MPITIEPPGPIFDGETVDLIFTGDLPPSATFAWSVTAGRIFAPDLSATTDNLRRIRWDTAGTGSKDVTIKLTAGRDVHERVVYVAQGRAAERPPLEVRTKLDRSATPATDDQVLWPLIRNQTIAIGFKSYDDFIDNLARSMIGSEEGRIDPCILVRGTYAYDFLRLATQIFLMCRCEVADPEQYRQRRRQSSIDELNQLFRIRKGGRHDGGFDPDVFDEDKEQQRLGQKLTLVDLEQKLREYLGAGERLPYLDRILKALLGPQVDDEATIQRFYGLLHARAHCPSLIELIWSYWHEEGMLAQSINAIALRFQNKRRGTRDALARLEIDPLRPLNNLLWGYIQNEHTRLSVVRRAYEYDHHYGLTLKGQAVPALQTADSRSKFIETFHDLLGKTAAFYRADADTTVVADAFPVLNALKDLHLVLAEGAHNQFGDLPWTARVEMLIEQWLLARPEMREFLGGRAMVPYAERWMGQVDTMKKIQGWNPTSVTHFRDLGVFGEQILLSVRYGDWSEVFDEAQAKNWARYWKPEVQGYIHAYRAATRVDLAAEPAGERDLQRRRTLPAVLIEQTQRLAPPMTQLPAPGEARSGPADLPARRALT